METKVSFVEFLRYTSKAFAAGYAEGLEQGRNEANSAMSEQEAIQPKNCSESKEKQAKNKNSGDLDGEGFDVEKALALYRAGWSPADIGEDMGYSGVTVYYHLRKALNGYEL